MSRKKDTIAHGSIRWGQMHEDTAIEKILDQDPILRMKVSFAAGNAAVEEWMRQHKSEKYIQTKPRQTRTAPSTILDMMSPSALAFVGRGTGGLMSLSSRFLTLPPSRFLEIDDVDRHEFPEEDRPDAAPIVQSPQKVNHDTGELFKNLNEKTRMVDVD